MTPQRPAGWLYKLIVDKHVTGPALEGQIQISGVWGTPSTHLHFSVEPPTDPWAYWQAPVYLADQLERNAEWQPISTAPNTKDEVLIFEPPGNIRVATRIPDTNTYLDGTTYGIYDEPVEFFPTHWMPLPKPPENA